MRKLEVISGPYDDWSAGYSKLFNIYLSSVVKDPRRITSLRWKASGLPIRNFFPRLASLECTRIVGLTDLLWFKWHLMCCPLKSVSLTLSIQASQTAGWFLSSLRWPYAQRLCLQGADLTRMSSDALGSLRVLDLKFCHGLDNFLAYSVSNGLPQSLRILRLTGYVPVPLLERLFSNTKTPLAELSLRIGVKSSTFVPLPTWAPSLSNLVLDFRRQIGNSRSLIKYTLKDFQAILQNFPHLISIGVGIDLRNRYQRLNLIVSPLLLLLLAK